MLTWDEHFEHWHEARGRPGQDAHLRMKESRKRVAKNSPNDWIWLKDSLSNPERKWFIAQVFRFQPVPKRLFYAMLTAGVLEKDPSSNRVFIEPCVRSLGAKRVLEAFLRYLESGTDAEKAGAVSGLYWVRGNPRNEKLDELQQRIHCQMLREFVDNTDLQVRRRIIPMLRLEPKNYPEELSKLVPIAIDIARNHSDEYIRHRVEIQLGAEGPFMAIPDTR